MRPLNKIAVAAVILLGLAPAGFAVEQRCGWLGNPTPGDLLLTDRQAVWSITSQGEAAGKDAAGQGNVPAFDDKQYVDYGNGHGYGCACLSVETDAKSERITRVLSGRILPLAKCKADKDLPAPQ
jgi:hypothetical protein